jgi:hypothetical protein
MEPGLFDPPEIAPQTFLFFEKLYVQQVVDHQLKEAAFELQRRRANTIVLSWDAASQRPVQQGPIELTDLARECEQRSGPMNIHLSLPPAKLKTHAEVLSRLASASGGSIRLEIDVSMISDWCGLSEAKPAANLFASPYRALRLPDAGSLWRALDDSLMRQLEAKLQHACTSNFCPTIGPIHSTIASGLMATWTQWCRDMNLNLQMRSDFLRWLVDLDPRIKDGWDGNISNLDSICAALVLMLATHVGEALRPNQCTTGNLNFRDSAIGLGSACEYISDLPISDHQDIHAWSVDALILSGAKEEMFATAGLMGDGGYAPTTLIGSVRVTPAVIQNTRVWRSRLSGDVLGWSTAVSAEFDRWKKRQDNQFTREDNAV